MSSRYDDALVDAGLILARHVGLRIDPNARGRLSRCVGDAAQARGVDVVEYVATLGSDPAALQDLLNRITVQETAFFRDAAQFEALARHVLPTFQDPVTLWSAACANGQEAYTAAIVFDELGHTRSRVVATDVSTRALERTRQARYSASEIRGLSDARRERYLVPAGNKFDLTDAIRSRVEVSHHNLVSDPPPFAPHSCPIVFCRNVLIYFSQDEIERFLDRLADWMPPGGWLFLGYSETLWGVTDRFELVRLGNAFVYRRCERRERREAPEVAAEPGRRSRRAPEGPAPTPRAARPRTAARTSTHQAGTRKAALPADVATLLAAGDTAANAGDHDAAIAAYRKCTYLQPDHVVAHVHLGIALERAGDTRAAIRAYAAARAALERSDLETVESVLEGFQVDELMRFLDAKSTGS